MSPNPDITFIQKHAAGHLKTFVEKIRAPGDDTPWRCLYAVIDTGVGVEANTRNIISSFLEDSFENADEVRAFWLEPGHLFIFFQGPVRAVIRDYENFLDFINEHEQRPEYTFFWQLQEFWGYFDQVLEQIIRENQEERQKLEDQKRAEEEQRARRAREEAEKEEPYAIAETLRPRRQARYKPLLLIVEDDRVTRHMLQASMEKYCDIVVAWDAQQAKDFYQKMLPNITFLDIELPDGDGQELAELFCAHDPGSYIVMVSGALSDDKIERCMRAGVKSTIAKPATDSQLLQIINNYHKQRRKDQAPT